ncbi:hypothetical protein Rsub_06068 [Raphidocelis subcapitata]|uniref:Uncharacterized protein n=1 Tax=Raphidocelis subcapitata TaxID=307507 RepID=A0A2V0P1J4_9CHLO|nr:hypothetical protein Rsub_06068 [Raphidocelis subcapitata]|eukprot:GBF93736.1 hypothetical protein Rsub_06068 [Raphidocelis subcapitata]
MPQASAVARAWHWLVGDKAQPGLGGASLVSKVCWGWVNPLIAKGWAGELGEDDARFLVPPGDEVEPLAAAFDAEYRAVKQARAARRSKRPPLLNTTTATLIRLYYFEFAVHSIWVLIETAVRLLAPVALREFLRWLQRAGAPGASEPAWVGWMWALAVAACGAALTLTHHVFFWIGMRLGYVMRQQVVSAIHAKVLRLNSASVAYASTGHVVNLASNDVRRLDDALPFWIYVWSAPLETLLVLVMVGLELGWAPAAAGVAVMLGVMPLQALLVQFVSGLRQATAARADERVRLTGEVISGALAMKMLGWEDPFTAAICGIRRQEVKHSGRMAQIRALNLALQFAMTPVVAFVTFATYRAMNGELNVPSVFYALSLLNLPKLTMVYFFVLGVQFLAELKVSLKRIDDFLSMPEPPPPTHQRGAAAANGAAADGGGAAPRKRLSLDLLWRRPGSSRAASGEVPAAAPEADGGGAVPVGGLRLGGADYDWNRNMDQLGLPSRGPSGGGGGGGAEGKEKGAGAAAGGEAASAASGSLALSRAGSSASPAPGGGGGAPPRRATLEGVVLDVPPGQLLGIAGEVGAGKSSLLAALLGELQPVRAQDGSVKGGPALRGRVAYCAQVPWIVAGSLKDNILFGSEPDDDRYAAVLSACALEQDLAELPAGDETELGERGINLSGGQKARVALARAAYSHADIILMDDPLSAVDPRVGRTLFDKCIGPNGLMAGRTRVLVTHQRQFLPRVDRVAVLRAGRIAAIGTWAELAPLQLPELMGGEGDAAIAADGDDADPAPASKAGASKAGAAKAPKVSEAGAPKAGAPKAAAASKPSKAAEAQAEPSGGAAANGAAAAAADAADFAVDESEAASGRPAALERIRTMAPDVNRRPADSGRGPGDGDGGSGSARRGGFRGSVARGFRSFSRAISDLRLNSLAGDADDGAGAGPSRRASMRRALSSSWRWASFRLFSAPGEAKLPPRVVAAARRGQLVKAEGRESGGVSWKVYGRYAAQGGAVAAVLVLLALLSGQGVLIGSDWWLALWAWAPPAVQAAPRYIWVYGLLVGLVFVVSISRASLFFASSMRASTRMHNAMIARVLRAPLSFFHTTPVGRVLNRFSNDLGRVDDQLPLALFDALQIGTMVVGALVLVSIAVPVVLPVFAPLLIAFILLRRRYIVTSREVKRMEAVTRSPVYAAFSATLKGLPTIRAYGAQGRFHEAFLSLLTLNGSWWYAFLGSSRWVGFRLDVISTATLAAGVLLSLAVRERLSAAILALALTHVIQLNGMLQWWVRQTAEVENSMTSVERMLEYTELPQEPPRLKEGGKAPPLGWPSSGALTYTSVWASYRPGLPPVLRDLTFDLPGGCSCGVVGRTGSGKSSLMLTLFRLIPVDRGTITLDGVDTSTIALDALRRQLAIIPQDPVLFSGTLRSNLDPWDRYADADLWEVLGAVQLKPAITAAGGLSAPMAEAGDNLSVGQRQLFCLARALLQDAKVLALDEATANVDRATDALIQSALRAFAHGGRRLGRGDGGDGAGGGGGRVLLVIAHRIDTILDTDTLLVLSNGELVESGPPGELTRREGGVFAGMVDAARAAAAAAAAGDAAAT